MPSENDDQNVLSKIVTTNIESAALEKNELHSTNLEKIYNTLSSSPESSNNSDYEEVYKSIPRDQILQNISTKIRETIISTSDSSDSDTDSSISIDEPKKKSQTLRIGMDDDVEAHITENFYEEMHRDFETILKEVCPEPIAVGDVDPTLNLVEFGRLHSMVGRDTVVVSTLPGKPALREGSVLFTRSREVLGPVLEIFGPVTSPMYVIIVPSPEGEGLSKASAPKTRRPISSIAPMDHGPTLASTDGSIGPTSPSNFIGPIYEPQVMSLEVGADDTLESHDLGGGVDAMPRSPKSQSNGLPNVGPIHGHQAMVDEAASGNAPECRDTGDSNIRSTEPQSIPNDASRPIPKCTVGDIIYYAPFIAEYSKFLFPSQFVNKKGSDASWKDNKEPPIECLDFSDDEQEREHKRNLRMKPKVSLQPSNNALNNYKDKVASFKPGSRPNTRPQIAPRTHQHPVDKSSRNQIDVMIKSLIHNDEASVRDTIKKRSSTPQTFTPANFGVYTAPQPTPYPTFPYPLMNQPPPLAYVPTPPFFGAGHLPPPLAPPTTTPFPDPMDVLVEHSISSGGGTSMTQDFALGLTDNGPPCLRGTDTDLVVK